MKFDREVDLLVLVETGVRIGGMKGKRTNQGDMRKGVPN